MMEAGKAERNVLTEGVSAEGPFAGLQDTVVCLPGRVRDLSHSPVRRAVMPFLGFALRSWSLLRGTASKHHCPVE